MFILKGFGFLTIYAIGAGHTKGTGATFDGWNESDIARRIASEVIVGLRRRGHTAVNTTVDKSQTHRTYLEKTCRLANESCAELAVFIHLNASTAHTGHGCEVFSWKGEKLPESVGVCSELQKIGFKNRGIKDGSGLFVIKHTTMPAMLIESFFIDNEADRALYKKHGASGIAAAIIKGLL